MSMLKALGIFTVGACVGAVVTYQYLNKKLDARLAEEIDSMREFYEKKAKPVADTVKEKVEEISDAVDRKFRVTLEKAGYNSFFKETDEEDLAEVQHPEDDKPESRPPYIISQEQFANEVGNKVTLTYYENADVLCEEDDILEDIEYIVGEEFRDHFGDEEEDVVYVRNEKLGLDYEIILDHSDEDRVREILGYDGDFDSEDDS